MSDKLETLKKELVTEIKELATNLAQSQSFVGLLSYESKFNLLHEKFMNLKFLERRHIGLDIFDSPIPMEDEKPEVFSISEERFEDEQVQEYIFEDTSSIERKTDVTDFEENVMEYSEKFIETIEEREEGNSDEIEDASERFANIDKENPSNELHNDNIDQVDDFQDLLPKKVLPKVSIDFNDRLAFLNQLFEGSQEQMDSTIQTFNHMTTLADAKSYLADLRTELNWSDKNEYVERLTELIAKRFD